MRLFLAALVLVVGTTPASAQWLDRPWPGIPRTEDKKPNLKAPAPRGPDGKPDLTGVWNGPLPEPVFDPAIAQPWINDLMRQRQREYHKGRPSYQCLPSGPEADRFAGWKRVLQTPAAIAILNDDLTYRVIFTDGRELEADAAPSWMGYSVGHWEGDTLIVDSNGYNDKTWLSRYGQAHTEALRIRERYRRADFGHMQVEVTFIDPTAYAKPWGFTANMTLAADTEMLETVCERSSEHWTASAAKVTVAPDVLARYVGVYNGLYGGDKRKIEVSLSGDQLIAKITGRAAVDGGEMRPLVPQSQTVFDGVGIIYEFVVDDKGMATALMEIHISGPQKFPKEK
ncbi:MAG TPA: hypothetical protein VN654_29525 [Vicinamibacterales bacterium]|jgi:hypothetical protein|nr:hypothetical protein [Vicinamibacterales bacterium]